MIDEVSKARALVFWGQMPARYNICPTDTIDTVIDREGRRELVPML